MYAQDPDSTFSALVILRDALSDIDGVCTCKIGIEAAISPADWPLIRIVPVRFTPGSPYNNRTAEIDIYFGWNTADAEGLENVYQDVLALEAGIITTVKAQDGRYIETVTDEDVSDTYKTMRVRVEMTVTRPTPA